MPVVVASGVVVAVAGYSSLRKVLLLILAIEANTGGNAKFHRMLVTMHNIFFQRVLPVSKGQRKCKCAARECKCPSGNAVHVQAANTTQQQQPLPALLRAAKKK